MTTNPMTKEQVQSLIKDKGSKIATVSFIKADGSIRTVNGMFKPTSKMVGSERGMAQGAAMAARGQIAIWEISQAKWKSFFADRVVEIN
tara:strand:+ start:214 stop:480 length:267 start_codon:yes stop_codon:yes gene_type:complete